MPADTALFIGWGENRTGREKAGYQTFGEVTQYFAGLQQQGQIESFEPWYLEPHGGDLNGFFLVRGELDKLHHLRYEDQQFQKYIAQATVLLENVGIAAAWTGQALQQQFQKYQEDIAGLV